MLKSRFTSCPWSRFFAHRSSLDPCLSCPGRQMAPSSTAPALPSAQHMQSVQTTGACPTLLVSSKLIHSSQPLTFTEMLRIFSGLLRKCTVPLPHPSHLTTRFIMHLLQAFAAMCFFLPPTIVTIPGWLVQGPRGFFLLHFRAFENQLQIYCG